MSAFARRSSILKLSAWFVAGRRLNGTDGLKMFVQGFGCVDFLANSLYASLFLRAIVASTTSNGNRMGLARTPIMIRAASSFTSSPSLPVNDPAAESVRLPPLNVILTGNANTPCSTDNRSNIVNRF